MSDDDLIRRGDAYLRTGVFDRDGREICVGDRIRIDLTNKNTKPEYWKPEYEVVFQPPRFTLKHIGGDKDSDTARFYFSGPQAGSREKIETICTATAPEPADVAGLVERILSMPHRMDCGLLGGYDGGCTCGHDQAVADAEAQARQIVDLTARVEAERERAEDQAALVTCGCAYDKPTDLCMAHKRILDRLRAADIARAEKAEAENARLRELVRRIPNALNQAFAAGMEEREHGSARRQAKCLEVVDALRADARAAEKGGDNG